MYDIIKKIGMFNLNFSKGFHPSQATSILHFEQFLKSPEQLSGMGWKVSNLTELEKEKKEENNTYNKDHSQDDTNTNTQLPCAELPTTQSVRFGN